MKILVKNIKILYKKLLLDFKNITLNYYGINVNIICKFKKIKNINYKLILK